MFKKLALILISIFCLSVSIVWALEVPAKPVSRVNDNAGMFSSQAVLEMSETLGNFEAQKGIQIVVATFPSLEGDSLEDFSIRLAEKWKIGQKGQDNGLIIVIFKNDRKVRMEVGYGLEAVLTDALCSQIITQNIVPHFKQENYDAGIKSAVTAILGILSEERSGRVAQSQPVKSITLIIILIIVFIVIIVINLGGGSWFSLGGNGYGGGGFSGGFGGGGGFSGGGGSFGGGGSSGGW